MSSSWCTSRTVSSLLIVVAVVLLAIIVHKLLQDDLVPLKDLPDLDVGVASISSAQIAAFEKKGHCRVDGLLSRAEAQAFAPHVRAAAKLHYASSALYGPYGGVNQETKQPGAFTRVDHLRIKAGGASQKLALSQRVARLASDVMRVGGVRLYKDTAFIKKPGDLESPWHQDLVAAPVKCCFVTVWIALSQIRQEMGPLWFLDGSHHKGRFGDNLTISGQEVDETGLNITQTGPLQPGDATIHAGWTIHGAPNYAATYGRPREAIALSYVADGTRLISFDEWRERGSDDKETWTMWQERGYPMYDAVLDNGLCPLVYKQKAQYVHDPRPARNERKRKRAAAAALP